MVGFWEIKGFNTEGTGEHRVRPLRGEPDMGPAAELRSGGTAEAAVSYMSCGDYWCALAVWGGGPSRLVPMASPERTSSTRRFCWRPSGVSLVAMGSVLPNPWASTLAELNALLDEVVANGLGAVFGELLIVVVAAYAVGVAFYGDVQSRIGQHDAGNFGQALAGSGQEVRSWRCGKEHRTCWRLGRGRNRAWRECC